MLPGETAKPGVSAKRPVVPDQREVVSGTPTLLAPGSLMSKENPPPYGAQHRQDALWKGECHCRDVQ